MPAALGSCRCRRATSFNPVQESSLHTSTPIIAIVKNPLKRLHCSPPPRGVTPWRTSHKGDPQMISWFKDSSLEISTSVTRGTHVVSPGGEITIYNCSHFKAALAVICAQRPKRLIVDLHDVDYIDASGLGVLVASLKAFRDCHTVIAIVATSIFLKKLF